MPKATTPRSGAAARRHNPLADDIINAGHLRTKPSKKNKHRSRSSDDEGDREHYIDAKMSRKILQIGQDLAEEEEAERRAAMGETGGKTSSAFDFESRFEDEEQMSDDEDKFGDDQWGDEEEVEDVVCFSTPQRFSFEFYIYWEKEAVVLVIANAHTDLVQEIDPNDLDMFHKFMPGGDQDPIFNSGQSDGNEGGEGTNLANLILEKIAAYEAKQAGENQPKIMGGGRPEDAVQIPAKAVEVFEKYVSRLLSSLSRLYTDQRQSWHAPLPLQIRSSP